MQQCPRIIACYTPFKPDTTHNSNYKEAVVVLFVHLFHFNDFILLLIKFINSTLTVFTVNVLRYSFFLDMIIVLTLDQLCLRKTHPSVSTGYLLTEGRMVWEEVVVVRWHKKLGPFNSLPFETVNYMQTCISRFMSFTWLPLPSNLEGQGFKDCGVFWLCLLQYPSLERRNHFIVIVIV